MTLHISKFGQGKPLVLIHGFAFSSQVFSNLVASLSHKYTCYLVDLPGFGQSNYKPYTLESIVNDLAIQLPKKVDLLGWSLGATIGLAYASKNKTRVGKLILVASNPKFLQSTENNVWPGMERDEFTKFKNLCYQDLTKALNSFIVLQFAKNNINRIEFKKIKKIVNSKSITYSAAINGLDILAYSDLREMYKELMVPSLSIYGNCDQLVPIDLINKMAVIKQKNSNIEVIDGAAHVPFISHYNEFKLKVDNFLC